MPRIALPHSSANERQQATLHKSLSQSHVSDITSKKWYKMGATRESSRKTPDKDTALTTTRRFLRSHEAWWWWELASLFLGIICLCMITVVLVKLGGKPLMDWRLSISPNALISVLTTVGKMSMLVPVASCIGQLKWQHFERPQRLRDLQRIDDASRGVWGSLAVLFDLKARAAGITLGAFITVVALAYEPSVQQILAFPNRQTVAPNETATILQATRWVSDSLMSDPGANEYTSMDAMLNGFAGVENQETFNCPTSTCEFPDFTSLAICSECQDISSAVKGHCNSSAVTATFREYNCTYTPQSAFFWPVNLTIELNLARNVTSAGASDFTTLAMEGNLNQTGAQIGVFNVTAVQLDVPYLTMENYTKYHMERAQTHGCSWSFCSATHGNITVSNGRLNRDTTFSPLRVDSASTESDRIVFTSDEEDGLEFSAELTTVQNAWAHLYSVMSTDNTWIQNPMNVSLMSELFQNVSSALTNLILSPDNLNATPWQGTALRGETYVHVRWPWFILPVALTLLTSLLLAFSMVSSAKPGDLLLKSSVLALLFHGLEGWEELKMPEREDSNSLEVVSKDMTVVFVSRKEGIKRFTKVESDGQRSDLV